MPILRQLHAVHIVAQNTQLYKPEFSTGAIRNRKLTKDLRHLP